MSHDLYVRAWFTFVFGDYDGYGFLVLNFV